MIEHWLFAVRRADQIFGIPTELAEEHRAWRPMRALSGKFIWPGQKYVVVKRFFDQLGRPPMKGLSWDTVYTPKEYTLYLLTKDSKKKISTDGSEFTGLDPQGKLT